MLFDLSAHLWRSCASIRQHSMAKLTQEKRKQLSRQTRLIVDGRDSKTSEGFVNIPPFRGSTVCYPDAQAHVTGKAKFTYGRKGNPTMAALEELWCQLEGAAGTVICPSGNNAFATALLALLNAGDHLLMTDSVYFPVRHFCSTVLERLGIEITYYDPMIGAGIAALIKPNTTLIYTESPGSQTFEIQDIPAICRVAKARNVLVAFDNTWPTPLLFDAFAHGVDITIHAGTKYPSGHSDVLIGFVSGNEKTFPRILETQRAMGSNSSTDDIFLTLRGIRTMELRLREQGKAALDLAHWLRARPEVKTVWHPEFPECPGHTIYKRDFKGPSGLFSIVLHPMSTEQVEAFLNSLTLFGMGYSWGGFESLIIHFNAKAYRTATTFDPGGPCFRIQVGLEALDDLKADLDQAFAATSTRTAAFAAE
jgi:cysteine-S-conjugate beta-lyase